MGRPSAAWAALGLAALGVALGPVRGRAAGPNPCEVMFVDTDDDNANGVADHLEKHPVLPQEGICWLPLENGPVRILALTGSAVHLLADGVRVEASELKVPRRARRVGLVAAQAGTATVVLDSGPVSVSVVEMRALDAHGMTVDLATMHASISRVLPPGLGSDAAARVDDDALRWVAVGPSAALPEEVRIVSTEPDGRPLDDLERVRLRRGDCPSGVTAELSCRTTPMIRAVGDEADRSHPESYQQSLRADVGGRLIVHSGGRKVASIRVGGPRATPLGPIERYRAKLKVRVVRMVPGGPVPVGGGESGAVDLNRQEVHVAAGLWGQCGITFGPIAELDVKVVDPPPAHLVAIGCNLGLPASGGEIAFAVGERQITVETRAGDPPSQVAQAVKAAIVRAGYRAIVSPNPLTESGALRTVDVMVRDHRGGLAALAPIEGRALSTDRTLGVCLGVVDLTDGLDHFTDYDSMSGTVEERSLIKGLADDDATTVEVFVIPSFSQDSRIGESFILADGSALASTVILDRAAIQVGARSFALAHELGHVFLNMPGHPDDYGVDTTTSLMDADATDPTIFGPRRLSVDECVKALVESGPAAPVVLLEPWPLYVARPSKANVR